MKSFVSLIITLLLAQLSFPSSGQDKNDQNLLHYVDSLFQYDLGYEYDVNSDQTKVNKLVKRDTSKWKGLPPSQSTFSLNTPPIILLDGMIVAKENLSNLTLGAVKETSVIKPGPKASALFGTSGKNGAVIIESKRPKRTKRIIDKSKNNG